MGTEIEKKYRLTTAQREHVLAKLQAVGARFDREDFEENTLFGGGLLNLKTSILRLRKTERRAILTYKAAVPSANAVKHRVEHETEIGDGEALLEILENLGYKPNLVYEKRRQTWHFESVEIVLDELPFGQFMEIEGAEDEILRIEKTLEIEDFPPVHESYPTLTNRHGVRRGEMTEARF
jgi:adenylate cyclase, class 2